MRVDIHGNHLTIGAPVAFATRLGNSHQLRLGTISHLSVFCGNIPGVEIKTDLGRLILREAREVAVLVPAPVERPEPREWR